MKKTPAGGTAIPRSSRRKHVVLLATALLVALALLMGVAGTLNAINVVATISVGTNPQGVGYNPNTNKVYVTNQGGDTVSVINGATDTVIGLPIAVSTGPMGVGVNPATNKVYVANQGGDTVSVLNGATDTVIGLPIAVGTGPMGVGVNPTTDKIYVANNASNTVSVINGATDTVITGPGYPIAVGTNPDAVGANPTTNKIYVTNGTSSTVSVIDGATDTVIGTPTVGANPYGVGVNPATNKVYVADYGSSTVSVINGATDTVITGPGYPIAVGTNPFGVGVNPATNKVYVANQGGDTVSVIDGATDTILGTPIAVGSTPEGVGANPTTDKVYVANTGSSTVSVLYDPSAPTTTGLSPDHKAAGEAGFALTVNGTGFICNSVVRWKGADRTTTYVSATQLTASIPATDILTAGTALVTVFTPGGGTSNAQTFTVSAPPPPTTPTWYLAEGTNAWGFSTYITIENPNNEQLTARLTYMDPNPQSGAGVVGTRTVTLPPLSQTTISSMPDIGAVDFSTKVECLQGKTIAVDRTMFWTGEGAPSPEGHSSIGTTTPSKTWYLPEGSSAWGFETWTLIQNPGATDAKVRLTYMLEGGTPQVFDRTVPAHCRATYNMASDIGSHDASLKVTSDVPVVAERSMYRNNRREGSCSIGATTPAADYFLAEGATGYDVGFTTYVLVQNPNDSDVQVTLTYQTQSGPKPQAPFTMGANSRRTVRVNDQLPANTNVSTQVHGSKAIIAERAMYWGAGTPLGEAMHASIGLDSPHMSFYLPDGQTSDSHETWTLVQNPNPGSVTVRITYLPQGGGTSVSFTDEIGANTRSTYNMADKGISGRASIMVQSLDGARPVMVERSMYWNNRGAGTNTVGGFSD